MSKNTSARAIPTNNQILDDNYSIENKEDRTESKRNKCKSMQQFKSMSNVLDKKITVKIPKKTDATKAENEDFKTSMVLESGKIGLGNKRQVAASFAMIESEQNIGISPDKKIGILKN